MKNIIISASMITALLLFSMTALASSIPQVVTTSHVSLGNSSCVSMECDYFVSWFYLPMKIEKPQYIKFLIYPACIGNPDPPYANETWAIQMYCNNGYNETIDLKTAMCKPASAIIRWFNITDDIDVGYFFDEKNTQYEVYWCAFKRINESTNRIPVEFSLGVDTLGFSNPDELTVIEKQIYAGATVINGAKEVFTINVNIFRILFYLSTAILVVLAFVIIIGFVPLMIKWIIKRVSK
jgi:hypothetical protein